jgi:propionate CoA-transferase
MKTKEVSAADAVALVHDGDVVICSGFGPVGVPDALLHALAACHEKTMHPQGLTLVWGGGPGDAADKGVNRLAREGLVARAIGGHWGQVPRMAALAMGGKIQAYNFPLGVMSRLYRDIASGLPGNLTRVGLGTFVDPRQEGAKINAQTTEDLIDLVTVAGEEMLYYRLPKPQVALIRATTADTDGNLSMENEALTQDTLAIAMAAKNSGGVVIAQVQYITEAGTMAPRQVKVPGMLVDCVVVAPAELHMQTFATPYHPALSGGMRMPLEAVPSMPLDERKIIARRAAFELLPNAVVNLGVGMPEGVSSIANDERLLSYITLTAESGVIGGVPGSHMNFGTSVNATAVLDTNQQFDFYDGGGLDLAILGLAECDARGNINVSRFGPKLAGAGGFINITQNSRTVLFIGTFTAGGLSVRTGDGTLSIATEGKFRKFVDQLGQITFSGEYAAKAGKKVLYITERCVFGLTADGLELLEVAPGIDMERDILAQMAFKPIIRNPQPMDARIFRDAPMGLKDSLLAISMLERISWNPQSNRLFINFQGLKLVSPKDVSDVEYAVVTRCKEIGHRVNVVVNYDGFEVLEPALEAYAKVVENMTTHYYDNVTRYSTSAFLVKKLGPAIRARGLSSHIYETRIEAESALG